MRNSDTEGYTTYDPSGNAAITGLGSSTYHAYNGYTAPGGYSNPVTYNYAGQYGAYTDSEIGLVLMGFRYYDPGTGRFLTKDPIGFLGGINQYAYVTNNPVNLIDPIGLWGLQFGDNGPNIGFGDPTWIFTGQNTAAGLKEGWGATADVLNPFGNPWTEMGYYNPCDKWVGTSQNLARTGVAALTAAVPMVPFATAPGQAVFWSGGTVAEEAASSYAAANGARTLTMTAGGRALNLLDTAVASKVSWPVRSFFWRIGSGIFALNASGNVRTFLYSPGEGSIWNTVEHPILQLLGRPIIYSHGLP